MDCSNTDRLNTLSLPSEEEENDEEEEDEQIEEEEEEEMSRSSSSRLARICLLLRAGRGEEDLEGLCISGSDTGELGEGGEYSNLSLHDLFLSPPYSGSVEDPDMV